MAMKSQNAYYLLLTLITILFVSLIFNFAAPILWSIVVSIIFYPLYEKLLLMTNKKSLSSMLSLILISLLVIMPSIAVLGLIGNELINFINSSENYSFEQYFQMIPNESVINQLIAWSGLSINDLIEILLSTETFYCLNSGSHCLAAVLKKNYGYPKKIVSYLPNLELTDLYSFGHVYENVDYLSTPGLKNDNISMPRKMRIYTGLIKKYFNDTNNL